MASKSRTPRTTKARRPKRPPVDSSLMVAVVKAADLKFHPRNYRKHPDDQLTHIIESISDNGFYRNVVVANDLTVLAGQGVVQAARKADIDSIPVVKMPFGPNSKKALKVLVSDNEISRLAVNDDRALSELLKDIMGASADALLGTGYDPGMLANLVFVTRPAAEIATLDQAKEWAGMPGYDEGGKPLQLIISFRSAEHRKAFAAKLGIRLTEKAKGIWYPPEDRVDAVAVKFTS